MYFRNDYSYSEKSDDERLVDANMGNQLYLARSMLASYEIDVQAKKRKTNI